MRYSIKEASQITRSTLIEQAWENTRQLSYTNCIDHAAGRRSC